MFGKTHFKAIRIYALFTLLFILTAILLMFVGGFLRNASTKEESIFEEYEPLIVIIDAGHGGEDCGAIGIDGTLEKHINLSIAKKLSELLSAAGIATRMTRTEDTLLYDKNTDYHGQKKKLDFARRLEIAQSYDNAVFISIHLNSFPQQKYSGLQVYYSDNSPESKILAAEIQNLARELIQPNNDRKIKSAGDDIYLLHKIYHPSVLVECGFLSNPEECQKLGDEEYQSALAFVLYSSVVKYISNTQKL